MTRNHDAIDALRSNSELSVRVARFHCLMGQVDPTWPRELDPEQRLLRAHVDAEEFAELLVALVGAGAATRIFLNKVSEVSRKRGHVGGGDLVEIADAVIDSEVVAAGTLVAAGVNDLPLVKLVMDANDAKVGGGKDPVTGKFLKPPGWRPPDIRGELIRQGWKP